MAVDPAPLRAAARAHARQRDPGSWPDPVPILSRSGSVSRQTSEFGLVGPSRRPHAPYHQQSHLVAMQIASFTVKSVFRLKRHSRSVSQIQCQWPDETRRVGEARRARRIAGRVPDAWAQSPAQQQGRLPRRRVVEMRAVTPKGEVATEREEPRTERGDGSVRSTRRRPLRGRGTVPSWSTAATAGDARAGVGLDITSDPRSPSPGASPTGSSRCDPSRWPS